MVAAEVESDFPKVGGAGGAVTQRRVLAVPG